MNTLHITVTSREARHMQGVTAAGQPAEYFHCSQTWFIGETQVYPWQVQIIIKWAIEE